MNRIATAVLTAIVGVTPILATAGTASADDWRRSYRNGKPVHTSNGNNWQGVGAGLAAGAALGLGAGLLLNRPPPPPPPVYYAPPPPPRVVYYPAPPPAYYPPPPVYYGGWSQAHVQWCLNRYRSYNPATNTFIGYDGYQRECVGPY